MSQSGGTTRPDLQEKLKTVPKLPGVYTFIDPQERIVYVGKAVNLRSRLSSYFQKSADLEPRKQMMVRTIKDFSFLVTENELEALVLEANMIKQYKPRYNVFLRDDKAYPFIKITENEEWPRLEVVRRIEKDGARYFGPYVPTGPMHEAIDFIRRNFGIRPCRYRLDKPMRPCIQYEIGRCPAPCAGYITREQYLEIVHEVIMFLKGERMELLDRLRERMERRAEELRFEEAASLRDSIAALESVWQSQKVISPELGDLDVIGLHAEGAEAGVRVFFIRNGVMIGAKDFHLKDLAETDEREISHSFVEMLYARELLPPPVIVLGLRPMGLGTLRAWLEVRREGKVRIVAPSLRARRQLMRPREAAEDEEAGIDEFMESPEVDKRFELLRMAEENARILLSTRRRGPEETRQLRERLGLKSRINSIGAFDISTISGSESVGAFVFWEEGEFRKENYRHLKIKSVEEGMDDYAMMTETVGRVLRRVEHPDLIVIDGGKGQLEAARKGLEGVNYEGAMVAVAKEPDRAFMPGGEEPLDLEDGKPSSLLLKRLRDEVHRFGLTFHRRLRGKRMLESPLESIPGVGKKRRFALLKHFGSIDAIRNASVEELASAPGMNRRVAAEIKAALGDGELK